MTPEQRSQVERLARCRMMPGSSFRWEKRFVRSLSARPEFLPLSAKQALWLGKLTHRYRRQLAALD